MSTPRLDVSPSPCRRSASRGDLRSSPASPSAKSSLAFDSPPSERPTQNRQSGVEHGSVRVTIRVRPFQAEEDQSFLCVQMPSGQTVTVTDMRGEVHTFAFDQTFWSQKDVCHPNFTTQATLYEQLGVPLLQQAVVGYNTCIFAYGQTGSGKSYSMLGDGSHEGRGLLPRIVNGIFEEFKQAPEGTSFKCNVSFLEIYNESIRDLLNPQHRAERARWSALSFSGEPPPVNSSLKIRSHPVLGIVVGGLTEEAVDSEDDVLELIDIGTERRVVGATAMNAVSSRSHCIFTLKLSVLSPDGVAKMSLTNFVDLAGSERQRHSKATGLRLKEGAEINQSLTTLSRVISALSVEERKRSILPPFRDSKLTRILQPSLCGNCKTVMMAAISPSPCDYEETMSTLRFAQSVKKVKLKATVNTLQTTNETESIESELRSEVKRLQVLLERERLRDSLKSSMQEQQQNKLKEQQSQLKEQQKKLERYEAMCRAFGIEMQGGQDEITAIRRGRGSSADSLLCTDDEALPSPHQSPAECETPADASPAESETWQETPAGAVPEQHSDPTFTGDSDSMLTESDDERQDTNHDRDLDSVHEDQLEATERKLATPRTDQGAEQCHAAWIPMMRMDAAMPSGCGSDSQREEDGYHSARENSPPKNQQAEIRTEEVEELKRQLEDEKKRRSEQERIAKEESETLRSTTEELEALRTAKEELETLRSAKEELETLRSANEEALRRRDDEAERLRRELQEARRRVEDEEAFARSERERHGKELARLEAEAEKQRKLARENGSRMRKVDDGQDPRLGSADFCGGASRRSCGGARNQADCSLM